MPGGNGGSVTGDNLVQVEACRFTVKAFYEQDEPGRDGVRVLRG